MMYAEMRHGETNRLMMDIGRAPKWKQWWWSWWAALTLQANRKKRWKRNLPNRGSGARGCSSISTQAPVVCFPFCYLEPKVSDGLGRGKVVINQKKKNQFTVESASQHSRLQAYLQRVTTHTQKTHCWYLPEVRCLRQSWFSPAPERFQGMLLPRVLFSARYFFFVAFFLSCFGCSHQYCEKMIRVRVRPSRLCLSWRLRLMRVLPKCAWNLCEKASKERSKNSGCQNGIKVFL